MAAFTSKAAGAWSASGQTTWTQAGVPASGDTVTITHAITVDVNTTIGAGGAAGTVAVTFSATLTVNAGITFTIKGDVVHGDANFILSAGSGLVFDTTGGTRKWLMGTASSQANCKVIANGTSGSHVSITKTGSNYAYFDEGAEGAGTMWNSTGWELHYCYPVGIKNSTGTIFNRLNDFGIHNQILDHCVFDNGGKVLAKTFVGGGAVAYRVEYCKWQNHAQDLIVLEMNCGTGAGLHTCLRNSFDGIVTWQSGAADTTFEYNYFDSFPLPGSFGTFQFNVVRAYNQQTGSWNPGQSQNDNYYLHDHRIASIGNPHPWTLNGGANQTWNRITMEFPHQSTDTGDGFYTSDIDNILIKNCLILPSATDGQCSTNLCDMLPGASGVKLHHNTVVGTRAFLVFSETTGSLPTFHDVIAELKSNIAAGVSQSTTPEEYAAAARDLWVTSENYVDLVTPTGIKNNYIHNPAIFTDPVTAVRHDGYVVRMSIVPDGSNTTAVGGSGPNFVDATRNAATWAVSKGAVSAAPSKPALPVDGGGPWTTWLAWLITALDATRTLLKGNPSLGAEMTAWIRAGFAPQNTALKDAGHDGVTIGAMEFSAGSGGAAVAARGYYLARRRAA